MPDATLALALRYLPRLRTVLTDVLGMEPETAALDLDMAESLAADDLDRGEVVSSMGQVFGIEVSRAEAAASESVADLLRLVVAKCSGSAAAYA